jgi:hypothetical protein
MVCVWALMAKMARRISWNAAAFACCALLAGCYPMAVYTPAAIPSGALAVPIRLLSEGGPFEQPPPYVIAAASLSSLELLVDAQYCRPNGCRGTAWAPISGVGGDVLLALPVTADGDIIESVAAWRGTGGTIMIAEGLMKTCSGGQCTAPMHAMYLAVVPRAALPDGVVTFQVAGESSRSTVDLRVDATT